MGRLWNVGLTDKKLLSATDHQLRTLKALYDKDYRGYGLTREKASLLITEGVKAKESRKTGLSYLASQMLSVLMRNAADAANEAAKKWLTQNPDPKFVIATKQGYLGVHGFIGRSYISAPEKNTSLYKWIKEVGFDDRRNPHALMLHHDYEDRLEVDLQFEAAKAALSVLREASNDIGKLKIFYICDVNFTPKGAIF